MDRRNSLLNVMISVTGKIFVLLLSLITTRYLILNVGNDANGLNSLFKSIIGVLSIAELGVGTAISYCMYEPIVNNDKKKVAALYGLFKKVYLIISIIILIVGTLILPLLPYITKDNSLDVNIYVCFIIYLLSVVLTYYYSAKTSLINAFKKNYITSLYNSIGLIIEAFLQLLILYYTKSFYLFLLCRVIASIIQGVLTEIYTRKKFAEIIHIKEKIDLATKTDVLKNVKAMFMHKIGAVLVNSADSIIISAFIGVAVLGRYSNYVLIMTSMTTVLCLFFSPLTSSIGHMCVKADTDYKQKYLFFFLGLNFILGLVFFNGYYVIISDLIQVVFSDGSVDLRLSNEITFVITINYFIQYLRQSCLTFRDATGTFYRDRYKPILEGVVNIVLSVLLVVFLPDDLKVVGVIISTIITNLLICHIIEPFVLFKYVFKNRPTKYYMYIYTMIAVFICSMFLQNQICVFRDSNIYIQILINGLLSVGISSIIVLLFVIIEPNIRNSIIHFLIDKDKKNIVKKVYISATKHLNSFLCQKHKKKIKSTNFCIISNNCWGGKVYQYFGVEYKSPTIGLFIPPCDFIKFCQNIKYYLTCDLKQINYLDSHNIDLIERKIKDNIFHGKEPIIGVLDDIEIIFLHYESFDIAKEKWNRRISRLDNNTVFIYKLNDNNGLVEEDVVKWNNINLDNKIFLTRKYNLFELSKGEKHFLDHKLSDEDGVDDTTFIYDDIKLIDLINKFITRDTK